MILSRSGSECCKLDRKKISRHLKKDLMSGIRRRPHRSGQPWQLTNLHKILTSAIMKATINNRRVLLKVSYLLSAVKLGVMHPSQPKVVHIQLKIQGCQRMTLANFSHKLRIQLPKKSYKSRLMRLPMKRMNR